MPGKISRAQYFAIRNRPGWTEKEIVKFYELNWFLKDGYVPTTNEVIEHINKLHKQAGHQNRLTNKALGYYFSKGYVAKALNDRGIKYEQHTQFELTDAQHAAALTVMNFADTRSTSEKLDQLGLTEAQWYAWLNDPAFKNFIEMLEKQNLRNIRPAAITEFTKKIHAGDWNALKYYLDITGAANNTDQPQSEQVLRFLIEILQEEIKDSATLARIATRMQTALQARTPLEVTSYVEDEETIENLDDDAEFQEARKKLGI